MKMPKMPVLRRHDRPLEYSPDMDERLAEAAVLRQRQVPGPAHLGVR